MLSRLSKVSDRERSRVVELVLRGQTVFADRSRLQVGIPDAICQSAFWGCRIGESIFSPEKGTGTARTWRRACRSVRSQEWWINRWTEVRTRAFHKGRNAVSATYYEPGCRRVGKANTWHQVVIRRAIESAACAVLAGKQ